MNELVYIKKDDIFTTSLIIAEGAEVQHHSVTALIKKHQADFEEFGRIEFIDLKSINSKRGRPVKICPLNEQQATLLVTYMENTPAVRKFKKRLVKEFYKMRSILLQRKNEEWIEARKHGKLSRRSETDVIKQLIEYAKEQGSTHSDMLYMTYTKLANKISGVSERDSATSRELVTLDFVENVILCCIREGMDKGLHYKEIYQNCKERLEKLKELAYIGVGA